MADFDTTRSLSDYQIISEIGSGAYGRVFKGRLNPKTTDSAKMKRISEDANVAIKVMPIQKYLEGRYLDRRYTKEQAKNKTKDSVNRELAALEMLSMHPNCHPSILCYHTHFYDEQGEQYVIITDLIDGMDLGEYIAVSTEFSKEEIVKFITEMLEALSYMHDKDIIHKDIKPANIMKDNKNDRYVLIDFGLMCVFGDRQFHCGRQGSPYYIPRSMFFDRSDNVRRYSNLGHKYADIYALGVTIWEIVVGRLWGPTMDELGQKRFPPLNRIDDDYIREFLALLFTNSVDKPSADSLLESIEYSELKESLDQSSMIKSADNAETLRMKSSSSGENTHFTKILGSQYFDQTHSSSGDPLNLNKTSLYFNKYRSKKSEYEKLKDDLLSFLKI